MGRYERRRREAINENYGKKLFMLTVEYVQRTEGPTKEDKAIVLFDCDGRWKRIVGEAKCKRPPVQLSTDTFNEHIKNHKAMNIIRRDVFGIKPTIIQKLKVLIQ